MSFRPLQWLFTPPPTLPPAPAPAPATIRPAPRDSRAARLIARLDDLNVTARYLEALIVERTKNVGVTLNLDDPELVLALERIYGEVPPGVSIDMYNYLLDAEAGIARAEIVLAENDGPYTVDPVQKADLQRINATVEDALVEDGGFEHQLPLLLRPLKNDRVIFDNLKEGLGEYPILKDFQAGGQAGTVDVAVEAPPDAELGDGLVYEPPKHDDNPWLPSYKNDDDNRRLITSMANSFANEAATPAVEPEPADVSQDTSDNLDERLNLWEAYYKNTMDLASEIDGAYTDLHNFADAYLYRPLAELEHVLKLLAALKLFFHKPKLKDLKACLAAFVMPRLISEISKFNFMIDRAVSVAVTPVETLIRSLGRLFGEIEKDANMVAYLAIQGGFTGMVRSAITGKYQTPAPEKIKALDTIPAGLAKLGSKLSWGLREMEVQRNRVEAGMIKAIDSKLGSDGDRLEVMQSLRAIDALTNITKGYIEAGYRNVGMGGSGGTGPVRDMELRMDKYLSENVTAKLPVVQPPAQAQAVFDRASTKENQNV